MSKEFKFRFLNCNNNNDYNDNDISTYDVFDSVAKICMHSVRSCHLYGILVHVEVKKDDKPNKLRWRLKDDADNMKLHEGPCKLSRFTCMDQMCLIGGAYEFRLNDAGGELLAEN